MKKTEQQHQAELTTDEQALQRDLESLSALMDAEADDLELRRLLKSMDQNPERAEQLGQHWQRFHLAQDLLHDRGQAVSGDIAGAVAAQLQQEPALQQGRFSGWQQNLARTAIAASVAVVFVFAMQTGLENSSSSNLASEESSQGAENLQQAQGMIAENTAVTVDPVAAERLRSYLEGISIDVSEPVVTEHIQDSPLYRLVNEVQD